jgi:N6-L-threonylcarbamoyladenine synthase
MLLTRLVQASEQTGIREIAIAGGVAANAGLRNELAVAGEKSGWKVYIPAFEYCTDNAAMIAMAAHFKYVAGDFCGLDTVPMARMPF